MLEKTSSNHSAVSSNHECHSVQNANYPEENVSKQDLTLEEGLKYSIQLCTQSHQNHQKAQQNDSSDLDTMKPIWVKAIFDFDFSDGKLEKATRDLNFLNNQLNNIIQSSGTIIKDSMLDQNQSLEWFQQKYQTLANHAQTLNTLQDTAKHYYKSQKNLFQVDSEIENLYNSFCANLAHAQQDHSLGMPLIQWDLIRHRQTARLQKIEAPEDSKIAQNQQDIDNFGQLLKNLTIHPKGLFASQDSDHAALLQQGFEDYQKLWDEKMALDIKKYEKWLTEKCSMVQHIHSSDNINIVKFNIQQWENMTKLVVSNKEQCKN